MSTYPKRLIEVDLPIKRISAHARREKSIRHGHISTLHIWWARRPLAACRAVLCAALWPDPADEHCPQSFRETAARLMHEFAFTAANERCVADLCHPYTWGKLSALRQPGGQLDPANPDHLNFLRYLLLDFIADFSNWDASTEPHYLATARVLTQAAHESLGGSPGTRPLVVDPFAGGGAIPLEALRVGADAFASDLHELSVFLNQMMLEELASSDHTLKEKFEHWAEVLRSRVGERLAELFPADESGNMPFAYFWSRTIKCEGPSCDRLVPLLGNPDLSRKKDIERSIVLEYSSDSPIPSVLLCRRTDERVRRTTKGGSATCKCGYTTPVESVRRQLSERNGGADDSLLLAVGVITKDGKKEYRLPVQRDLDAVRKAKVIRNKIASEEGSVGSLSPFPNEKLWGKAKMNIGLYGMTTWEHVFTSRQLVQLRTFQEELSRIARDENGPSKTTVDLLAIAVNKLVDYSTSLCRWVPGGEFVAATIGGEKKIPMMWDYTEVVLHGKGPGSFSSMVDWVGRVVDHFMKSDLHQGVAIKADARVPSLPSDSAQAVITDPPYYDAIWYGDLSDLFAVWIRRTMTLLDSPLSFSVVEDKEAEIIKSDFAEKDGLSPKDDEFYEHGMADAFSSMRDILQPTGVCVIVFAHKSTSGWEAILSALIDAGWVVVGSWPIDTERAARMTSLGQAALASSIHLVCRPRENPDGSLRTDAIGEWRDVLDELPGRIHEWMPRLAQEGVVGADAIFACLGPALEIYSRYSRVERADGAPVPLGDLTDESGNVVERGYLSYVWEAVSQEALTMIFEGADTAGFEADARLTAMWL